jgi:hypothetical protein
MRSTRHLAVYNARNPNMLIAPSRFTRAATLLLALLCVPLLRATDWKAPQEQLAEKIAAVIGPGAIAMEVTNRSSLSHADIDRIRQGLSAQLASLGLRFVNPDQANATVQVSLSENLQNYVWLAEIRQGTNEPAVVMISTPRSDTLASTQDVSAMTIHKTLLWSQDARILDIAVLSGNPQQMVVLDQDNVSLYKFDNNRWRIEQALAISHMHPWPRDLRGRLVLRKGYLFDAYLPGVFCRSSIAAPLTVNCYESDDPWPLGTDQYSVNAFFAHTRNFFTGALAPGVARQTAVPAFYSAAPIPREKYVLWLFAAVDGQIHMLDGLNDLTVSKLGWGSDIASVHSNCGSGWQVLAAGSSDSATDTIGVFEIADREPASVAQSMEFSGYITALWTQTDGGTAIAVSRASETGKYAAYRLTITCSQ